jgi:hypothetical protein
MSEPTTSGNARKRDQGLTDAREATVPEPGRVSNDDAEAAADALVGPACDTHVSRTYAPAPSHLRLKAAVTDALERVEAGVSARAAVEDVSGAYALDADEIEVAVITVRACMCADDFIVVEPAWRGAL